MKHVVYDTNVALDVLLQRDPHFQASARALDAAGCGQVAKGIWQAMRSRPSPIFCKKP